MKFLLVNGEIKFPSFIAKNGMLLLEKPEDEKICERLELTEVEPPNKTIQNAVAGRIFERYQEAKEFLGALEG